MLLEMSLDGLLVVFLALSDFDRQNMLGLIRNPKTTERFGYLYNNQLNGSGNLA